jgi:cytochrome c5
METNGRARASAGRGRFALGLAAALAGLAACAGQQLPEPNSADLALARAEDPSVALEDLQRGRETYARRCSNCHALRAPSDHSPSDWGAEVTRMQREHAVRLTPDEERDILRYLRAASARQAP